MAYALISPSQPPEAGVDLPAFPGEVLWSIFEFLSPADLRSLCLVCKAIRAYAEPLFYSQIDLVWSEKVPRITSLLRTLFARPQLAAHVKRLSLGGTVRGVHIDDRRYRNIKVPVPEEDVRPTIAYVESLKLPDDGFWVQELRAGTVDAYVAVLLSQLPNLRRLDMCGYFTKETILFGTVFWCALCEGVDRGLPAFEYLEQVSVKKRWAFESSPTRTTDLLPLFYLPALKHLQLWLENPESLSPNTVTGWPTGQVPKACMLRSLELVNAREPQVQHVLAATTCLQTLKWVWNHDREFKYQGLQPILDLDEIARAMDPIKDTLTHLQITAWTRLGGDDIEDPHLTVTGSLRFLRHFSKLRTVEMPLVFMVASLSLARARPLAESLPRNLEHLTLSTELVEQEDYEWTGPPILDALRPWLGVWRDYTPNLRGFHLTVDLCHWEWTASMRDELVELGVAVGLQIQVTESEELKASRARFANR